MNNWHARNISDLVLESGTDIINGRTTRNSEHNKRKKNNNIFLLPTVDSSTMVRKMASDASLILLVIAFLITSIFGQLTESLIGILIILAAFVFGVYTQYRSSLRITNSYRLLLPDAKVVENGIISRLSVYDVEVNDLITFSQGDIITADARLVASSSLVVAERIINEVTGRQEYKKYQKDHLHISDEDDVLHSPNMVYAGSMVVAGKGSAIVTAIGNDTVICKNFSAISIVSENDRPTFFRSFLKKSRTFSLAILLSVIPICLLGICTRSLAGTGDANFLSMFALSLALAATSMSEPIISAAETIITKELLPSSIVAKSEKTHRSKVTKFSSAEEIALTDTFLILSSDTLIDQRQLVRHIFFSGAKYRFDTLRSNEIRDFVQHIAPYFSLMPSSSIKGNDKIIGEFISSFNEIFVDKSSRAKFLKNFPVKGARSCVFEFDSEGNPCSYITATADISLLQHCNDFRTEGGGLWNFSADDTKEAVEFFSMHSKSEFSEPIAFFSRNNSECKLVFEGIVCVGEEFPYVDGEIVDDLLEAGIHPILVLESETSRNIEIANKCGFLKSNNDIAISSDYQKAGLSVSDAHLSTKIYIGFGRKGTQAIAKRLADNSRKVLPIIKDSANRYDVLPYNIYATHVRESLDSVKIASSLSIVPNIAEKETGGIADALKAVQASSMAFLKLGVFKNYLVFSAFLRIFTIGLPLLFGYSSNIVSANALLLCGFFSDFAALFSIAYFCGVPVNAKNALAETKKLFYLSSSLISVFCALISSVLILCTMGYLVRTDVLSFKNASTVISIFLLVTSVISILGFLLILRSKTRDHKINICYMVILAFLFLASAGIFFVPDMAVLTGVVSLKLAVIPYIAASSVLTLIIVVLLIGNLSSFSSKKQI